VPSRRGECLSNGRIHAAMNHAQGLTNLWTNRQAAGALVDLVPFIYDKPDRRIER
jgi:hypothetical protein